MVERRDRRRVSTALLVGCAAVVTAGLTGCSPGVEAGTLDPAPAVGAQTDAGDLAIRNALLVKSDNSDDTAVMAVTIVNTGDARDTLTAVELAPASSDTPPATSEPTESEEAVTAEMHPGVIVLEPGATVVVPTDPRPTIQIDTDAPMGTGIDLILRFDVAGTVTVRVPIVKATGMFATLTPSSS